MVHRHHFITALCLTLALAPSAFAADSLQPGQTALLSRTDGFGPLPAQADGNSYAGINAISADGRYTVFVSGADDLGVADALAHAFVRDDQTGTVTLLDRAGPGGAVANGYARSDPSISADGTRACFVSQASNLVAGTVGSTAHAYVVTIATGAITLVDRATGAGGAIGDAWADHCVLDATGATAAFSSSAHNLVPGATSNDHVFVRHLGASTTQLVDSYQGAPGDSSAGRPAIDAAGDTVAFASHATNLNGPGGDQNGKTDVYARSLAASQPVLVSRANGAGGAIGNGESGDPSISDDGKLVAFDSAASNFGDGDGDTARDIHVRDLAAGTTQLVSRAEGAAGAKGDGDSWNPAIAGDGSAIAFATTSSNLGVDAGRNEEGPNAYPFLRVLSGGHTIGLGRASGAAGTVSQGYYDHVAVDRHATNVVFTSMNADLDPLADGVFAEVFQRHLAGGFETRLVSRPVDASGRPAAIGQVENDGRALSADGRFAVFTTQAPMAGSSNGLRQVYLRDALLGTTQLVSRADGPQGAPADMEAAQASISADGTRVAFSSAASNLPGGDGVSQQVYVRDLVAGTTTLASTGPAGPANTYSFQPVLSQDGTKVAFGSGANNLVSGDNNGVEDVFVRDLVAGTTTLASLTSTGSPMQTNADDPLISADGTRVGFVSSGDQVVPDEAGGGQHLYVRDLAAGTTTQVDRKADGSPSDSPTDRISMSADGNRFLFSTEAKLTPDSLTGSDAYVRDVAAGTTTAVGVGPNGEHSTAQVFPYSISFDGTKVAIVTHAGAFSAGDPGGGWLREIGTGTTTSIAGLPFDSAVLDADGGCVAFQSSDSGLASPSYSGQDVDMLWLHAIAGECPVHAPDTTITSGPDGKKTVRQAYSVFAYRADESATTFACSLDDRPMKPCGDTFHTGALRDGVHRFKVAATDRAGNTDPTPALVTFKVGVPPRVTKLRLDHRGRLVFRLSEKARVRVQLTRTGRAHSASVGRLTVKRSLKGGTRRIKLPLTRLRSGHYHATVTATDAGGNRSVPKRKSFDVR